MLAGSPTGGLCPLGSPPVRPRTIDENASLRSTIENDVALMGEAAAAGPNVFCRAAVLLATASELWLVGSLATTGRRAARRLTSARRPAARIPRHVGERPPAAET